MDENEKIKLKIFIRLLLYIYFKIKLKHKKEKPQDEKINKKYLEDYITDLTDTKNTPGETNNLYKNLLKAITDNNYIDLDLEKKDNQNINDLLDSIKNELTNSSVSKIN
jgi:hypothetical protein